MHSLLDVIDTAAEADRRAGALFSQDGLHRLRLWRTWNAQAPVMVWVLLNPSVADAARSDLTLAKCIGFAKRHGCGGVVLVNLFTLVSTDPLPVARAMHEGTANHADADTHIRAASRLPLAMVVAGWGSQPWAASRARTVLCHLRARGHSAVLCFGRTKDGSPRHPSRIGYDTPLEVL